MNTQETMSNYEEKQMLSKMEYEQYFEECEKTIKNIKLQAIRAIEKRDREIDELKRDKTQTIEVIEQKNRMIDDLKKSLKEEWEVVSQQMKEIKNKTDKIVLFEGELSVIKELIENKNSNELDSYKKALEAKEAELRKEQEAHSELKEKFDILVKKYNKDEEKWKEEKKDFNEQIKVYEQIETEKERIKTDLENLKEEIHYELYKQYCNLPSDFRNEFTYIVPTSIFAFLQTSGRERILQELHTFIHGAIQKNQPWAEDLKSFFDLLFKASQIYEPSLKRLETKEGDDYDSREMVRIKGESNQRKVADVLFLGYKKGGMTKESLVEVK